jgi:hypothetical protein
MKLEDPKKLNPKYIEWLEKELIKLKLTYQLKNKP